MSTQEITRQTFKETLSQGGIVVLDWWAPWCGPCRAFAPVFERVAKKHPGVVFGKVNTQDQPELAQEFDIQAIPTLMVIKDNTLVFSQAGMLPERALEELIAQAEKLDVAAVRRDMKAKQAQGGLPVEEDGL